MTRRLEAVEELWTEAPPTGRRQDILVFLSGEREIRDAADALNALKLPGTEVLPLFARLSAAEQHRVFHRGTGRRIILATNVAETSLTVPGIGYVVDTGTARISRYSQRTKVQRLPIEPVSQASAATSGPAAAGASRQGICIRLYSEEDFEARPEFTEPEILRTTLASVILQMTSLGLGDITRFPFVDPPDADRSPTASGSSRSSVPSRPGRTGPRTARRSGTAAHGIRPDDCARLPLDPRHGADGHRGRPRWAASREVLVLVAALSIQDPRERPRGQAGAGRRSRTSGSTTRRVGLRPGSTPLALPQGAAEGLVARAPSAACARRSTSTTCASGSGRTSTPSSGPPAGRRGIDPDRATAARDGEPDWDAVHRALLAGLLSHVGVRDEQQREYAGARGARFGISPGSALFRQAAATSSWPPSSSRRPGCGPASMRGSTRSGRRRRAPTSSSGTVSEPRWSRKAGAAVATERVTLYGVPLVTDRTIQYAGIDPEAARELFVRSALVEGDWDPQHEFWRRTSPPSRRVAELEERARRRDIVVDDEVLFAFYDSRIPPTSVSEPPLRPLVARRAAPRPDLLTLTEEILTSETAEEISAEDYPRVWRQGDLDLDVTYQFSPGSEADGVTVHVPVAVLNRVSSEGFDWQVPGLRDDLAVALLKSLPKATRRHFVPTPDHAMAALSAADPARGSLTDEMARVLHERTGVSHPARGMGPQPRAGPPADHLQRRGPGREGGCTGQGPRPPPTSGRRSGPRGDGRGRCVPRAHRPHHVERRAPSRRRSRGARGA